MDLSLFLTSFFTTFMSSVFFVLLFTWLSRKPGNRVVYYPNRIVKGLPPSEDDIKTRSPFAWIKESFTCSEDDIINISGVDTAVYFVFLSTVLKILVSSGTFLLPSLLPIAWTANGTLSVNVNGTLMNNGSIGSLERFSMANVEENSPRLWAFLLATYVVSFSTFYMLWKAYNHVAKLRVTALSAPDVKPELYAIVVRDIPAVPKGMTRKEQVDSYFKSLYPDEFYGSMVITDNREVNKICKDLTKYRNKLAHAEAKFATSRTRPISQKWFLFCKKVDTINFCQRKIDTLVPKLRTEQEKTIKEKQKNSAFIFFKNKKSVTSVAQTIHAKMAVKWTVEEAPEPRQVLWRNLGLKFYQRQLRKIIVYLIVVLTLLFYYYPTVNIFVLETLLKNYSHYSLVERVVYLVYLPQIILIAFLAVLPKFLMFLSRAEGIPSVSHVVRASSGKHFYFVILNGFIGITFGLTTVRYTSAFLPLNYSDISYKVWLEFLPLNSTYFLSFVALKFLAGYGFELSRSFSFIMFHLKKKFFCRTDAEVKKAWAPGDMNYAFVVPDDMLIVTIVLCYSVVAPVIILFGAAYFSIGWLVLRNQALNVYIPSYESYGRMWPHMHARILAALIIYHLFMILSFSYKHIYCALLVIPLPILSIVFAVVCRKKFYKYFRNTHPEVDCLEMREPPNLEAIYKAYIPPCLRSEDEAQPVDDGSSASFFQLPGFQGLL